MKSFAYKQVLFALREEYKKNEKRLAALKKHVTVDEEKITDFGFFIDGDNEEKYIELYIKTKQGRIESLLNKISRSLTHKEDKKQIPISHEFSGEKRYLVTPVSDYYEIDDLNGLLYEAHEILGTEFAKNINDKIALPDKRFDLITTSSGVLSYTEYFSTVYPPVGVLYRSVNDRLMITAYEDAIYSKQLFNIFGIEIPEDKLKEYHLKAIEQSNDKDKGLIVEGLATTRATQFFDFEDKRDNIYIKRVK